MRWRAEWLPALLLAALGGVMFLATLHRRDRRGVLAAEPTGYLDEILLAQDSVLYRWPVRQDSAIRVFVEPSPVADDSAGAYPALARETLGEWRDAGFPMHYAFVADSANAEIAVRWRTRFAPAEGQRIGQTDTRHVQAEISSARVTIALHDSAGRPLSPARVSLALRHELGHALGLNHTADSSSVMFPVSATAMYITDADGATMRALYRAPRR